MFHISCFSFSILASTACSIYAFVDCPARAAASRIAAPVSFGARNEKLSNFCRYLSFARRCASVNFVYLLIPK